MMKESIEDAPVHPRISNKIAQVYGLKYEIQIIIELNVTL